MNKLRLVRTLLWVLVVLALAGFAFLLLRPPPEAGGPSTTAPQLSIGGPFTLTDVEGRPFPSSRLQGRPHAIFFGFTHCPDVCPTTLARLVKLRNQLGRGDQAFDIVFVTVDPERDGPKEVGQYAALFDSPVIGLTGSPEQVDEVKKQFNIFSRKVPDGNGGYSVDHTATVLLFGRDGEFAGTIAPEEQDEVAIEKLERIA